MKILILVISLVHVLFALNINHTNVNIIDFQLKYLEDTQNQYNIDTILNQKFIKITTNKQSFGLSKDKIIWLKTDITVNSDIKKLYLQHVDTVNVTNIELYFLKDKKVLKTVKSGIENKETDAFDALLKVDVKQGETYTFVAKYSTKNSMIINLNILDEENYYNSKKNLHILFAIFIGVISTLLIYNIYLYFALKYIQYLYFSILIFCLSTYAMIQVGIYIEFFPVTIDFYKNLYYILFPQIVFFYLFTQNILNTKKTMPYVHQYFNFSIILTILSLFYTLFISSIYEYLEIFYYTMVYTGAIGIFILLWAMYKKIPFIYYYNIATLPSVVFMMILSSLFLGYIDYSYITRYGYLYVYMYEIIIYAILVSYYIKEMQTENELQRMILNQKEKQASLGELLVYITHQWRAPLASLSSLVTLNEAKLKKGIVIEQEKIAQNVEKSKHAIKFMSETIDNFSSFYNPRKIKTNFTIMNAIQSIKQIIDKNLLSYQIQLSINGDEKTSFYGVQNDLSQIILALISNAKHIFKERKIQNPQIIINFYEKDNNVILEVSDNAGGIKIKPIESIFEPFVSGIVNPQSGIGLYMVKNILDMYKSSIDVKNENDGVKFTITLKGDK